MRPEARNLALVRLASPLNALSSAYQRRSSGPVRVEAPIHLPPAFWYSVSTQETSPSLAALGTIILYSTSKLIGAPSDAHQSSRALCSLGRCCSPAADNDRSGGDRKSTRLNSSHV